MGGLRVQQGAAFLRHKDEYARPCADRILHRSAHDSWEGHVRVSAAAPAVAPMMVGILVHGGNHFIVRGPPPGRAIALSLARHWSVIQIGAGTPPHLEGWRISTREFREDLEWAVLVPGDGDITPAVAQLLAELA